MPATLISSIKAIIIIIIISLGTCVVTSQTYLFELPLNQKEGYHGCQDQGEFQP